MFNHECASTLEEKAPQAASKKVFHGHPFTAMLQIENRLYVLRKSQNPVLRRDTFIKVNVI